MLKDQFHLDRKQMQGPPETCITSCIITSTCWHTLASKITFTRKDNDCRNNIGIQGKNHHAQECICMLRGGAAILPRESIMFGFCSANADSFNSLFKILFISPSWYLFGIGLNNIFMFWWTLPPTVHSNAKGSQGFGGLAWGESKRPAKKKKPKTLKIKEN